MNTLHHIFNSFLISLFCLLLLVSNTKAVNTVTIQWNQNPESDVEGYRLYYGLSSGNYTFMIDVGNVTSTRVSNLLNGNVYYFAVTAYNSNSESLYSSEVYYAPVNNALGDVAFLTHLANGTTQLTLTLTATTATPPISLITIQYSDNLIDWFELGNISNMFGTYFVIDNSTVGVGKRFYRLQFTR